MFKFKEYYLVYILIVPFELRNFFIGIPLYYKFGII